MENRTLYVNKRSKTLYAVSILTATLSVFVFYMIFSNLELFLQEFETNVHAIFWTTFMVIMGNIMFLCMLWMSGRYVVRVTQLPDEFVAIKTWSILGWNRTKIYPESVWKNSVYQEGKANYHGVPSVNAPWLRLKTPSGKTLVVDLDADFL